MTLTDLLQVMSMDDTTADFMEKSPEMTTCELITTSIAQAARDRRLIHGLCDCASALSRNPSDVVICILPVDTGRADVNKNIQMLLIESICLEYDIPILKLDIDVLCSAKLVSSPVTCELPKSKLMNGSMWCSSELDCFLIQHGDHGLSNSDKKLLNIFQDFWNDEHSLNGFQEFPK